MRRCTFALVTVIVAFVWRQSYAQTDLGKIAEWASAEGFVGELKEAPSRALGYEGSLPIKQKAFRGGGITHLLYVTNFGDIVLGYVTQTVTILWRLEGGELKATAHGDIATRKMWPERNSEHAALFEEEVAYWKERWVDHGEQNQR